MRKQILPDGYQVVCAEPCLHHGILSIDKEGWNAPWASFSHLDTREWFTPTGRMGSSPGLIISHEPVNSLCPLMTFSNPHLHTHTHTHTHTQDTVEAGRGPAEYHLSLNRIYTRSWWRLKASLQNLGSYYKAAESLQSGEKGRGKEIGCCSWFTSSAPGYSQKWSHIIRPWEECVPNTVLKPSEDVPHGWVLCPLLLLYHV